MKKFFWLVLSVLILVFLISFISSSVMLFRQDKSVDLASANIGVIEVNGVITESFKVLEDLRELKENSQIKALVVRLDTPGGAVGASQEIYLELKKLREKMPVVISMGNVAASGGLYIAISGSHVVALPGSITGSMGVLMPITNVAKLMDKIYVEPITIKSGQLKDAGNPFRPMDAQARAYLQEMVDQTFAQFQNHVKEERKLSPEAIKRLSDGRVVDGVSAKEIGLVDSLGTFEDAVNFAKEAAQIEGDPKLAFLSREPEGFLAQLIRGGAESLANTLLQGSSSVPQYLFDATRLMQGAAN